MAQIPGFAGPFNLTRSASVDREDLINFYIELSPATPRVVKAMYGRPGITPFAFCGAGPIRGCVFAPEFQRAFVVSGGTFWEVYATGTVTARGSVAVDGNPATLFSNGNTDGGALGNQIFLTSGGLGYI